MINIPHGPAERATEDMVVEYLIETTGAPEAIDDASYGWFRYSKKSVWHIIANQHSVSVETEDKRYEMLLALKFGVTNEGK